MNENVLRDIIKSRNVIRKKYKALKIGRAKAEIHQESKLKPVTESLKKLLKLKEISLIPDTKSKPIRPLKGPIKKRKVDPTELVTPNQSFEQYDDDMFKTPRLLKEETTPDRNFDEKNIESYFTLAASSPTHVDNLYGFRFDDESMDWKIGDSKVVVKGNDLYINDKYYEGTPGLYELIFMKNPNKYTQDDLQRYGEILADTNAYRRNYSKSGQITGSKSKKYKNIVSRLLPRQSGMGLMQVSNKKMDYVYWNDPNELVDRLRLLVASQQAGHNNHTNEIVSIVEELREANIIN